MSNSNIQQLQSIPIFSKLSLSELEALEKISYIKSLKNSEILFYEGDKSTHLHILITGAIKVYKVNTKGKEIILKKFPPCSFIAEVSNFSNIEFPASAKSIGTSTILIIDYAQFEEHLLYNQNIASLFLNSMAKKVLNLEKVISENLTMDATQRVAKFLYENERLLLESKHHEIAQKLNITPVTFSRILTKLKQEQIVTPDNEIKDKIALKELFS